MFVPQLITLTLGIAALGELFFMFCTIFRKPAPSIVVSILSLLLLTSVLSMATTALKLKDFKLESLWLGGSIENLATVNPSAAVFTASLICIIVYFVASYIVSMLAVKKMEV